MPLVPQISPFVEKPQKRPSPNRMEGTTTTNFHSSRIFVTTTTTPAPILMQTLQPLTIKVCFTKCSTNYAIFDLFSQFSTIDDHKLTDGHKFVQNVILTPFVKTHSVYAIQAGKETGL
jgi:hypothetical protein